MTAYEKLTIARKPDRPTSTSYIKAMFKDFSEMHGDRCYGDDRAVISGIAYLDNIPVTVIAIEKGVDIKDRICRNFGSPKPEGYRKALRAMRQAEKFKRPVICIVDTAGAYCGIDAEERGQGQAIAENLMTMISLKTKIISVIIGEGGSGGALALAVADKVFMLENAVYSVISPEGCASILWKDSKRLAEAAECLCLTADNMLEFGVIEKIVKEDFLNFAYMCNDLKDLIKTELNELSKLTQEQMLESRYNKFRKIGKE